MHITPLSDAVGALVEQVDLTALSHDEFAQLRGHFCDYGVLFFRDQHLSPQQHIDFAERFGEIEVNRFFKARSDFPQIAEVTKEPDQTSNIGGGWHTDHSYDQVPAMGSILLALETPPSGGDTLFAGMAAAYEALDDGLKAQIADLQAIHSNAHIFGAQSAHAKQVGSRFGNAEAAGQEAVHPIVLTHPDSGRKGLYVNPAFTTGIVGMEADESGPLLMQLYAHIMQPRFHCRWHWAPGSIALWDNRATWHNAMNDYHGHRRHMNRITVKGVALH